MEETQLYYAEDSCHGGVSFSLQRRLMLILTGLLLLLLLLSVCAYMENKNNCTEAKMSSYTEACRNTLCAYVAVGDKWTPWYKQLNSSYKFKTYQQINPDALRVRDHVRRTLGASRDGRLFSVLLRIYNWMWCNYLTKNKRYCNPRTVPIAVLTVSRLIVS